MCKELRTKEEKDALRKKIVDLSNQGIAVKDMGKYIEEAEQGSIYYYAKQMGIEESVRRKFIDFYEQEKIKEMWVRGMSHFEIGKELNRHPTVILNWVAKLGLREKKLRRSNMQIDHTDDEDFYIDVSNLKKVDRQPKEYDVTFYGKKYKDDTEFFAGVPGYSGKEI